MDIDNLAKTYPNQLVEVDYMSAHAIIKSKVFRAGANYLSDFNAPVIDQEGNVLTRKAKALGFKPYLATGCVIYHIPDKIEFRLLEKQANGENKCQLLRISKPEKF